MYFFNMCLLVSIPISDSTIYHLNIGIRLRSHIEICKFTSLRCERQGKESYLDLSNEGILLHKLFLVFKYIVRATLYECCGTHIQVYHEGKLFNQVCLPQFPTRFCTHSYTCLKQRALPATSLCLFVHVRYITSITFGYIHGFSIKYVT